MASTRNGERKICRGPFRSTCGGIKVKQLPYGIVHRLSAREYINVPDTLPIDSLFNCEDKDLSTLREIAFGAGIGDAYALEKGALCERLSKLRSRIYTSKRILGNVLGMGEDVTGHGFYSLVGQKFEGYHYRARAALLYLKSILPVGYLSLLWEESPHLDYHDKAIIVHSYEDPFVLEMPENITDILKRSMKYKYIATTIVILYPEGTGFNHANAIIFDNERKLLQIWEPGINVLAHTSEKWARDMEDVFQRWLEDLGNKYEWFGKGWVTQHSIQFCPRMDLGIGSYPTAPQDLDLNKKEAYRQTLGGIIGDEAVKNDLLGYCLFWSVLMIYIKMKNPDAEDGDIMKYLTSMDRVEVGDLVRQFTSFVAKMFVAMGREDISAYYIRRGDYITGMRAPEDTKTSRYGKDRSIKMYGIVNSVKKGVVTAWVVDEHDLGKGVRPRKVKFYPRLVSLTDENIYTTLREHFRMHGIEIPT